MRTADRHHRGAPVWIVLVALLVAPALAGCTGSPSPSASTPAGSGVGADAGAAVSALFVQEAASGTMAPRADGSGYDLVLTPVAARTTWFSDRPERRAGSQPTATVVDGWAGFGFDASPPNAALVVDELPSDRNTVVVELRSPTYDAASATLTYDARVLDGPRDGLPGAADHAAVDVPPSFGPVSLFIDDADVQASVSADGSIAPSSSAAGTTVVAAPTTTGSTSPTTTASSIVAVATTIDPEPPTVTTSTPSGTPPAATSSVVGPAAPASSSPVLAQVISTWTSMTWTLYSHQDAEDPSTGRYQFDCVGATNYFLKLGAPNANDALRAAYDIADGYVPTPSQVAAYFAGLPAGGTSLWTPVAQASGIQPGDVIAVPPSPGSTEPGHAMIAAGPPLLLANGSYAVLVYDSTALPAHGPADTRTWDTRNQPLQPGNRASGLGSGTVEITVGPGGAPDLLRWSVGGVEYGGQLQIARPLS